MVKDFKLLFIFIVAFAVLLASSVSSADSSLNSSYEAFIGVLSSNNTLLIQPPQGGSVSIVNFTELSSVLVRVSSTEAKLNSTELELSSTKSELSSTKSDLSSTKSELLSSLARTNDTNELLFAALSSALNRISALEASTPPMAQSPCRYLHNKKSFQIGFVPISSFSVTLSSHSLIFFFSFFSLTYLVVATNNNNGSFIVVVGGNYLSSVEIFSSVTQTWTDLPPMTTERGVYPATCAFNKTRLIVCGGSNSAAGSPLSSCEMLDLNNPGLRWMWVPVMSTART